MDLLPLIIQKVSTIGLIKASFDVLIERMDEWSMSHGLSRSSSHNGGITVALNRLDESHPLRIVVVETQSEWTAVFMAGDGGIGGKMRYFSKSLASMSVCATYAPHMKSLHHPDAPLGATMLQVYDPKSPDGNCYGRTIAVAHDGTEWVFHQSSQPLPFEIIEYYERHDVASRFTLVMLRDYLGCLGLNPYVEAFYGNRFAVFAHDDGVVRP